MKIQRETKIIRTARVAQLEGMFEVPPSQLSQIEWDVNLPLDDKSWNIGLIVGPSGCGKTTVAREVFGAQIITGFDWPPDHSIVDAFPAHIGIRDITALLSSVGFSSPPSWLKPFRVLSNGEQFRVTLARAMAENQSKRFAFDEFTSVVDRTVAQIGSHAIAKAIRKTNGQFVAIACHYDIQEWLQPDWVYQPHINEFTWRAVQPRPRIELEVRRVAPSAWQLFAHHHYLNRGLHKAAACFVALINNEPVAFTAVLSFPHPVRPGWREHRTVCLPDYQGAGIGNALSEYVAALYRSKGTPYRSATSSPAMIHHRARSALWKMIEKPHLSGAVGKSSTKSSLGPTIATDRLKASFEFVGEAKHADARAFGVI